MQSWELQGFNDFYSAIVRFPLCFLLFLCSIRQLRGIRRVLYHQVPTPLRMVFFVRSNESLDSHSRLLTGRRLVRHPLTMP